MECVLGRYDWCTPRSRHVRSGMRRRWVRLAIPLQPRTVFLQTTTCSKRRSLTIPTHIFSARSPVIHDKTWIESSTSLRPAKLLWILHHSNSRQRCSAANSTNSATWTSFTKTFIGSCSATSLSKDDDRTCDGGIVRVKAKPAAYHILSLAKLSRTTLLPALMREHL